MIKPPDEQKPAEQAAAQKPAAADQPAAPKPQEPAADASKKPDAPLSELLSLFEDDDSALEALESLCRTLPNIGVDELVAKCREELSRFRTPRSQPAFLEEIR